MSQGKFTNLSIIHNKERQISNDLCVDDVSNDFAKYNYHYGLLCILYRQ